MTLIFESSKRFSQDDIETIVKTIADNELFKFDLLRKFGWCSSYSITECSPEYLELSWMNSRSIRKPFEPPANNLTGEICSCQICKYRFED